MLNKNWTDINKDFAESSHFLGGVIVSKGLNNQQEWESEGINYEEAKNWTDAHFQPKEIETVQQWRNLGFIPEEVKEWLDIGLEKNECDLVSWFYGKKYNKGRVKNYLKRLRREYNNWEKNVTSAQEYLDSLYPKLIRKRVKKITIAFKKISGSLDIDDFPQLEIVFCISNKFANISISNCPNISKVDLLNNELTNLNFLNNLDPKKLIYLSISANNFSPQDLSSFSKFTNLEDLKVNNNSFYGSLEPLRNLKNLEILWIGNTNIDSGLEYLPPTVEDFFDFDSDLSKNQKTEVTKKELLSYSNESDAGVTYNFQLWRVNQSGYQRLKKVLDKINPTLNIEEIIKWFDFFNVRTGTFEGNLQGLTSLFQINKNVLEEKEAKIALLEARIQELIILIKEQKGKIKEKITNAYLHFAPVTEKEALEKLIQTHREFIIAKEQGNDSFDFEEQCYEIKKELKKKRGKEFVEEAQLVLADYEKLIIWELELEEKINAKSLLLEEQKQIPQITIINSNISIPRGHFIAGNLFSDNANLSYKNEELMETSSNTWEKKELNKFEVLEVSWQTIHHDFTEELTCQWQSLNFTFQEVQDWANAVGNYFNPSEYAYYIWLKSVKEYTPERLLNEGDEQALRKEYQNYQQQAQIEVPSK